MVTPVQVLEVIRSISFGALVVNAVLFAVYLYYPGLFPQGVSVKELLYIGTALGTALHRGIHVAFFNPLTASIAKSFSFYAKYLEIYAARRNRVLSDEEFERYSSRLKEGYYGTMGVDAPEQFVAAGKRDPEVETLPAGAERTSIRIGRTGSMREVLVLPDIPLSNPLKAFTDMPKADDTSFPDEVEAAEQFDPTTADSDDADDADALIHSTDDGGEKHPH